MEVMEVVDQRDELVVELLIQKARQAKRQQIQVFVLVQEQALHLVGDAAPFALQIAFGKAQRRDARLQPMPPAVARLEDTDQNARQVDVLQLVDAQDNVF